MQYEERKEAIRKRWLSQDFVVFPDGEKRPIKSVSKGKGKGIIIAGEYRYDAGLELVGDGSDWSVIFTADDSLGGSRILSVMTLKVMCCW